MSVLQITPPMRTIGLLIAASGLLLTAANTPGALAQTAAFAPAWTAGAVLCVAAMLVLTVGARRLAPAPLTVLWITVPTLGALLLSTWALAYRGGDIDVVDPWVRGLLPAFICFPLLLVPGAAAVGVAAVFCLLPALSTIVFLGALTSLFAVNTVAHLGNLMFLAIMLGISHRLRQVYERETEVREARRREVWARAHAEQQRALARLVHDEVLATLTAAAHVSGSPPPVLREAAVDALTALTSSTTVQLAGDETAPVRECARTIESALGRMSADVRVVAAQTDAAADASMPTLAASAFVLAAAEAIRNASRHTGSAPRVTITVAGAYDELLRIDIDDDGDGFDPHALPTGRLGVRESIVGRVEEVGGTCVITSVAGKGSSVSLRWPA
jgi:signal transduction histidine kinase